MPRLKARVIAFNERYARQTERITTAAMAAAAIHADADPGARDRRCCTATLARAADSARKVGGLPVARTQGGNA